jgi:catechol 2,3-dioxygenase-like lactoylglutathione lyase family enzyme
VLFAKDLAAMARFYAGVAGLAVVASEADLIVLASARFELVLHALPPDVAASIAISRPPALRTEVPTKLVLPVASLAAARAAAPALGGALFPEARAWEAMGFRACDGFDPEGNVLQFRERRAPA